MRYYPIIAILVFLLISGPTLTDDSFNNPTYIPHYHNSNHKGQKVTLLTFYVEQQAEQTEDYLQVSFEVKVKDSNSLKKAIDGASAIISRIKKAVAAFCQSYGGNNCSDRVAAGNHKIIADYQYVRRQPQFKTFIVSHAVTVTIKEVDQIGQIFDNILSLGIYKINGFEWKPNVEADSQETAINKGIEQGKQLCKKINRRIGEILAIQEVYSADKQEQQEKKKPEDQEQEEQEDPSILKFQIQCVGRNQEQQNTQSSQPSQPQKVGESTVEQQSKKQKKKKKKKEQL